MKSLFRNNLIDLPESFEQVTDISLAEEVDPVSLGLPSSVPGHIWRDVEKLYATRTMPAISMVIRHKGQIVLKRSIGHAAGNGPHDGPGSAKRVMSNDTPVCLFSASKAISAMLVHKLAEEGLIDLDAPVAEYIPEFAARGKQYVTVEQVLTHKSGIPIIQQEDVDPSILWDWDACVKLLCEAQPRRDVGQAQAYHAVTGGFILGEIMRRVTGDELNQILASRVAQPLGSQYMSFGLAKEDQHKAALNYQTGRPEVFPMSLFARRALGASFAEVSEISNSSDFMSANIPAGNIYATAQDACDFFQALLDGGKFQGNRLFERVTVSRAITEASQRQFDRTLLVPLRTSEGFMLGDEPFGLYGPRTREAFGHLGFISIFCWADPSRDISVAMLTTGKPVISPHLAALVRLLRTVNRSFPKFAG